MKIAIDIRNIGKKRTGDEVVFFNLVKNLSGIDKENDYVLLTDRNPENDAALAQEIQKLNLTSNFKVVNLAERGTDKFLWNAWVLPKYLRKNPVDILQVQYITPFFVPKKTRIVTIIHDVSFKALPGLIGKADRFLLDVLLPRSLARADKIIGVSKFTADEIKRYFKVDPKKIEWIHNAAADNFFSGYSQERLEAVRKKYGLPPKFVLYIGTLQPRKNLPALIEAYIKIPTEKRQDLYLVLAGGKGHNYDARIDEFIRNYALEERVLLPGYIADEDKPLIFKLAQSFCFPSLYEGFGIPVLEAMTLGVPVLASRIPPHEEIIADSALMFDVKNADEFADKLTRIVGDDNLRADLASKERARAADFSWRKTAEKVLEIYHNLDRLQP